MTCDSKINLYTIGTNVVKHIYSQNYLCPSLHSYENVNGR